MTIDELNDGALIINDACRDVWDTKFVNDIKVYVVTACEYSDKHIIGIFSSESKAKEFIKSKTIYNENEYYDRPNDGIESFVLDEAVHPQKVFAILDIASNKIEYRKDNDNEYYYRGEYTYSLDNTTFTCFVTFNPNKEAMNKVVYDSYAMYKAREQGL